MEKKDARVNPTQAPGILVGNVKRAIIAMAGW